MTQSKIENSILFVQAEAIVMASESAHNYPLHTQT